jgi:peptidoglycan hydrolase-like protein with peptidoglycan-binding domain
VSALKQAREAKQDRGHRKAMANLEMDYDSPRKAPGTLDILGLGVAASAALAILVNALFLQEAPAKLPRAAATVQTSEAAQPSSMDRELDGDAGGFAEPAPAAQVAAAKPSPLVKEVQAELARRGIYEGTADGLTGPRTASAIRSFEIVAGLEPTGEATPKLLSILRQQAGATPPPAAGNGDADVLEVQRMLARLNIGSLKPDGIMGEATRSAIRRFEAGRGIPPLGEVTPALKRQLAEAVRSSGR